MKISGIRIANTLAIGLLLGSLTQMGTLLAQAPAATPAAAPATTATATTASIHGHVNDALGTAIKQAVVKLTTDRNPSKDRKFQYSFDIDNNGDYKGSDIKPGTYVAVVFKDPLTLDYQGVQLVAGTDKALDFDMSRPEYINKMNAEDRARLEEYKKQNAKTAAENAKIQDLNKMLIQARADTKAGNFARAIEAMTQATTVKPEQALLWTALGDAQLGDAVAAEKTAKTNHATDVTVPGKLKEAVKSYQEALARNEAAKPPVPGISAVVNNQLGQALSKLAMAGDPSEKSANIKAAAAAYETAAKADPKNSAIAFTNEAAVLMNANISDEAAAAADKAIAADPTKPEPYYIKGQALIQKVTIDEKTQKPTVPAGCFEAYQKYLELAPDGPHAADVKGILEGFGQSYKATYYKSPSKKK
ncbi:MAG: carboxypeptidase-like regulatory domain-containing protein [Candidatus Pacebacteria bacterium]|nr:carboxypeptidase-like regulatory domain-containing protein [Candidatus Paceibacterota bacterium]